MKDKLRGVVVNVPSLRDRWNGLKSLGMILNQTVVQGHVDAGLRLARTDRRIKTLRLVTGDVPQNIAGWRDGFSEERFVLGRDAARHRNKSKGGEPNPD